MRTLRQRKDWRTWITQEKSENTGSVTLLSDEPRRVLDVEAWDKTDREFRFPARHHAIRRVMGAQTLTSNPARTRWLKENDVYTHFVDIGVGCCWFAQVGDEEPVTGETEDEAIARLAQENGLELWGEGTSTDDTGMRGADVPSAVRLAEA